jgi:hypothetical protein
LNGTRAIYLNGICAIYLNGTSAIYLNGTSFLTFECRNAHQAQVLVGLKELQEAKGDGLKTTGKVIEFQRGSGRCTNYDVD